MRLLQVIGMMSDQAEHSSSKRSCSSIGTSQQWLPPHESVTHAHESSDDEVHENSDDEDVHRIVSGVAYVFVLDLLDRRRINETEQLLLLIARIVVMMIIHVTIVLPIFG